jgi:pyruvate dehydrogenase E2 component (dihydrolipoamide acetyltransferase)
MAIEVRMPKFGLTMHDGTVQRFFKSEGDQVREGEPLYEIETEKVLYEVESPGSGVLAAILCAPDETIECGALVAVIAASGEDPASIASKYQAEGRLGERQSPSDKPAREQSIPPSSGSRKPASPIARKIAAELKVDLGSVAGTGPGGRITREDVELAAASMRPGPSTPRPLAANIVPMRGMRRQIAERMSLSLQHTAQLTIVSESDVTAAWELHERAAKDSHFTFTDMAVCAAGRALKRHPRLNSRLTDAGIELIAEVNIGVAVALEEGLIVPVIRDADRKTLTQIAAESAELARRARSSQLKIDDVSGGTFTVSNLGQYGVDSFTPIINHGEAAILGLGRIIEKPAAYRGAVALRSMMSFSLTFDHRLIDGAPAAIFLQTVVELFNTVEL